MWKHTPEKWEVKEGLVYGSADVHIIAENPTRTKRKYICRVHTGSTIGKGIEERDANARLIVKAPEMLDVLAVLVGYVESVQDKDGAAPKEWAKTGRALLTQIEGE